MRRLNGIIFIWLAALTACGCVGMRDYVGASRGYLGLDVKKGFGQGNDVKDYVVTDDGTAVIYHDTKEAVFRKLGPPDEKEMTLDGDERWIYDEKNIELFFSGNYLKRWKLE
ncbi:MAG: hypothetical protein ABH872_00295 [Candidatus Omnitrophota bacterium]